MKKINSILCILFLFSCGQESNFEMIPSSEIDNDKVEIAKNLAVNILETQKAGGFYQFKEDEAIIEMRDSFDEQLQKRSYEKISGRFGDFLGLEFSQVLKSKDGNLYEIYRFNGKFNSQSKVEIRVVLDGNRKLAGFFVKPWKDRI